MSNAELGWTDARPERLAERVRIACGRVFSLRPAAAAADCGSLAGRTLCDPTTTAATSVTPPSSVLGKDPPTPVAIRPLLPRTGHDQAVPHSDITFEVWLPPRRRGTANTRASATVASRDR